ncbi:hypothetical protein JY96_04405 [Aquabacterium sp. NJ1]|uniref:PEP-CTERM sorting domain-containing protein n=1 Tax=Aquabacterium sp. NJ1 TaxID=1538295 RepID=UPI00052CED15|nr:PEP-CTERM sorting domain-containing protein [Aquabacterium sp. NJ1]KGM39513.1 hypothetical protein JY96_04405 [Aquabacterium sp. NJ1]
MAKAVARIKSLTGLLTWAFCATAMAAPQYTISSLSFSPLVSDPLPVSVINDQGMVATQNGPVGPGTYGGIIIDIGQPIGTKALTIEDLNNGNVAVGTADKQAFTWQGGQFQMLAGLNGANSQSAAHAVNEQGVVVGESGGRAVVWRSGQAEALGGANSSATGVNEGGVIVGNDGLSAGVWNGVGQFRQLSGGDGGAAKAVDINDTMAVAGAVLKNNTYWAARWDSEGNLTVLNTPAGTTASTANAINNNGSIVGQVSYGLLGSPVATLWEDGQVLSLKDLLVNGGNWTLQYAYDINDAGQIVGLGTVNGQQRSFLLSPVPEPSTLACLGLGLVCMAGVMQRGRRH